MLQSSRPTTLLHIDSSVVADHSVSRRLSAALVEQWRDADAVVIGAPMYNFAIPTQLRAWIDRIVQAGRTFHYTDAGPIGLAGGKRVVIVSSRGGGSTRHPRGRRWTSKKPICDWSSISSASPISRSSARTASRWGRSRASEP